MADSIIQFTPCKQRAIKKIIEFVDSSSEKNIIPKGYTGKGKTKLNISEGFWLE